ncbi:ExbD/TolR family protein [Sphingomonas soli]|uniref:ExbD/TolR family protein n=1 Tax=Sphingomonas soli TaxID=266127 RepID=UPI000A5F3C8B|nr:biopolymer transporter ExbD [Sphingomonas soli]
MANVGTSEPTYFKTLNVTPFIDVMLVLLVIMLLSLPVATHKLPLDLPNGPPKAALEEPHLLHIDKAGALSLDGRAIPDEMLAATLAAIRDRPGAVLQMHTDPDARYARFDAVLAVVKRAGITRLGFVGHEPLPD